MEPLYVVHWRTRTGRRPRKIAFPLQQEERPNPGIDGNSEDAQRAEVAMREAQYLKREGMAKQENGVIPAQKRELHPMAGTSGFSSGFTDPNTGEHQRFVGPVKDNPDFVSFNEAARIYREGYEAAARQDSLPSEVAFTCSLKR